MNIFLTADAFSQAITWKTHWKWIIAWYDVNRKILYTMFCLSTKIDCMLKTLESKAIDDICCFFICKLLIYLDLFFRNEKQQDRSLLIFSWDMLIWCERAKNANWLLLKGQLQRDEQHQVQIPFVRHWLWIEFGRWFHQKQSFKRQTSHLFRSKSNDDFLLD